MGDACLKLDDEVVKLIKIIASALLKDATQDDLAIMSQQTAGSADANSEFGRLQRLPGFARMQKQLFFNMMTARQDLSGTNVRIEGVHTGRKGSDTISPRVRAAQLRTQHSASSLAPDDGSGMIDAATGEEQTLGRETIKNISRLIVDRDSGKARAALEKAAASK